MPDLFTYVPLSQKHYIELYSFIFNKNIVSYYIMFRDILISQASMLLKRQIKYLFG